MLDLIEQFEHQRQARAVELEVVLQAPGAPSPLQFELAEAPFAQALAAGSNHALGDPFADHFGAKFEEGADLPQAEYAVGLRLEDLGQSMFIHHAASSPDRGLN